MYDRRKIFSKYCIKYTKHVEKVESSPYVSAAAGKTEELFRIPPRALHTKIIAIMYIGCAKMQFFRYKHTNNLIFWYLKLKNENVLWWADTTRPLEGGRRRERERGARKAR